MQIRCSTRSVLLNVMVTQYTCSLNSICLPDWPVQWSHHCSGMHIPVHSPWLHWCRPDHSCYINNGWTFSRQTSYTPHTHTHTHTHWSQNTKVDPCVCMCDAKYLVSGINLVVFRQMVLTVPLPRWRSFADVQSKDFPACSTNQIAMTVTY